MYSVEMLEADLPLPGVQRVCEDVQAAHHDGGITSCKSNIWCHFGKTAAKPLQRRWRNLTKERNPVSDKSCQLTKQAAKRQQGWQRRRKAQREQRQAKKWKIFLKRKMVGNMCTVPGNHLFFFVWSTTTAAEVLAGRRQEVQTVVLKCLVCEREQDLKSRIILRLDYSTVTWLACKYVLLNFQTLAKNLISWSWGDLSVFPLVAIASVLTSQCVRKEHRLMWFEMWFLRSHTHRGVL